VTVRSTGTCVYRLAASGEFSDRIPGYAPAASPAVFKFRFNEVVAFPAVAESVPPGIPLKRAVNARFPRTLAPTSPAPLSVPWPSAVSE